MNADLQAFHVEIEESFRRMLPNSQDAPWLADLVLNLIRDHLAGLRIPTLAEIDLAEVEARAAELLPLGASVVAERQGCHRSTVYRRVHRYRSRNAA